MGCPELALLWRDSRAERRGIEYLKAPSRNFQSQWKEEVRGLISDEQDTLLGPEERRRYDSKFSFTTLRLLRREDHLLFRRCRFETEKENFMFHLIKATNPDVLVPKVEEGEVFEDAKIKAEPDKGLVKEEPERPSTKKARSVPANESRFRKRKREEEEDEVFWFPEAKSSRMSERKLKDTKVKKESSKDTRKEYRSKRSRDEKETGETSEMDIHSRDSFERSKRDHERHIKKDRGRKWTLDRTSERIKLRKGKVMIEDISGAGKKQDRDAREEARRKRFAPDQDKIKSMGRSRRR